MITYWHRRTNITIGTVTTLPAGSNATASVDENNVLSLGIPTGPAGPQGLPGPEGEPGPQGPAGTIEVPVASASTLGGVIIDGEHGLTIDGTGLLVATGDTSPEMIGASASEAGAAGVVPQPLAGDNVKFLRGDATWAGNATTDVAGLMSAADKSKLDDIDTEASKSVMTRLWVEGTPVPANSYLAYFSGDVVGYDFIIIKFLCRKDYDPYKYQVFVPESDGQTTYRIKSCLQYCGFESNKNGSRSFTASYAVSGNQTSFVFGKGYFDGQANANVCIPMAIWGVKL